MPARDHTADLAQVYVRQFFGADARQLRFWSGS